MATHIGPACRRLLLALSLAAAPAASAGDLAITGARIVQAADAPVIARGTVLVADGRIVAVGAGDAVRVPPGTATVDAAGRTLVPGFWNSHVHLIAPPLLDAARHPAAVLEPALRALLTRWGVTTAVEVGGAPGNVLALRARIAAGEVRGPRLLSVDAPFYPAGGTPAYVRALYAAQGLPSAEVADAAQARARAKAQLDAGADGVKLFAGAILGGPGEVLHMDPAIAGAGVAEAHARGRRAFAHPTDLRGLGIALDAGVDVIVHTTPVDGPWPDGTATRMAAQGAALVPTLKLFDDSVREGDPPAEVVESFRAAAAQQVAAMRDAGGVLLFGTDGGFIEDADPGREYALLAQAGLGWREVLAMLTSAPADYFGAGAHSGRIAPGKDADMVLLARSPEDDIGAFGAVAMTIRGGAVIHRAGDDAGGEADAAAR